MKYFFWWGGGGQCLIGAQAKLAEYPWPELKGNKSLEGRKLPTSENTTAAKLFFYMVKRWR